MTSHFFTISKNQSNNQIGTCCHRLLHSSHRANCKYLSSIQFWFFFWTFSNFTLFNFFLNIAYILFIVHVYFKPFISVWKIQGGWPNIWNLFRRIERPTLVWCFSCYLKVRKGKIWGGNRKNAMGWKKWKTHLLISRINK